MSLTKWPAGPAAVRDPRDQLSSSGSRQACQRVDEAVARLEGALKEVLCLSFLPF